MNGAEFDRAGAAIRDRPGETRDALPADLDCCLERSAALHRHLCPRQVLGARIGLYAGELLELDLPRPDKRLLAFVETDGCLADGISVATGCWLGRRTMRLVDHGKVAATFVDTRTERGLRIWPDSCARTRAREYAPTAPSRWHAQLLGYQVMPTTELLRAEPIGLLVPVAAIVSRPGLRTACASCGEEIINGREVTVGGCTLCRACAGERYYVRVDSLPGGCRESRDSLAFTVA